MIGALIHFDYPVFLPTIQGIPSTVNLFSNRVFAGCKHFRHLVLTVGLGAAEYFPRGIVGGLRVDDRYGDVLGNIRWDEAARGLAPGSMAKEFVYRLRPRFSHVVSERL